MDSECEKLKGIITLGNFKRYLKEGKTLVNEKFTALSEGEDEKLVKNIFDTKEKIMSIPFVRNDGKLVKEYCREEEKTITCEEILPIIEQTCREVALAPYDKIIFMLGGLFYDQTGIVEKIYNMTDGKIIVLDSMMFEKTLDIKSQDKIKFYDIGNASSSVTRLLCLKYNIDYTWYIKDDMQRIGRISKSLSLYKKVGILTANEYYTDLFSDNDSVYSLNSSDLQYNSNRGCYEYVGDTLAYEDLEAVFGVYKISEKSCIFMNGRYIPMIVSIGDYYGFDEDIALNIIPRLNENGVKSIVICSTPEELKPYFGLDIKHRAQTDLDNCQEIFEEEQKKFWRYKGEYCQELREEFNLWQWVDGRHYSHLKDVRSRYINYCEGERYTCGNQEDFERTMYLFGLCIVAGFYVADEETLGSFLRNKIDSSIYISNRGSLWSNINYVMRDICYESGDIVIILGRDREIYELNQIPVYSILDAFLKVPNLQDNIWDIVYHCNSVTMQYVADKVYDICMEEKVFSDDNYHLNDGKKGLCCFGKKEREMEVPEELREWLVKVRRHKVADTDKAGAIVMNCNPFTRGHRYLIEQAAKQVDVLYIFVLEENKSFFEFEDRLKMVKLGVADLKNVIVIPSGKYMISSVTLPGYFEKENNPYGDCDAANDLGLFGGVIAKEFNVQIRFAGEEPIDIFTRQYNQSMRRILPRYGVEFKEIPRKESGGEVISASRVRKYMKEQKFEEVRKLVLPEVYRYLEEHYF